MIQVMGMKIGFRGPCYAFVRCLDFGAGFASGSLVMALIYTYIYIYTCEFNFKSMKLLDFSTIVIASNNQGLDGLGLRWECQLITIQ
jgi:hypothetical protein